jgi:hypothetical protein
VLVLLMERKYAVLMTSDGMIYTSSFMTIGSGIKAKLKLLCQEFERLQC